MALLRRYRLSHGLLLADALIAATALVEGMPLVSKNQRDYRWSRPPAVSGPVQQMSHSGDMLSGASVSVSHV